jgi:hypothetical protein
MSKLNLTQKSVLHCWSVNSQNANQVEKAQYFVETKAATSQGCIKIKFAPLLCQSHQ